jgi:hypothetical protein
VVKITRLALTAASADSSPCRCLAPRRESGRSDKPPHSRTENGEKRSGQILGNDAVLGAALPALAFVFGKSSCLQLTRWADLRVARRSARQRRILDELGDCGAEGGGWPPNQPGKVAAIIK